MEDENYISLIEQWIPLQADILADLEYERNLFDHLVTTETIFGKFRMAMEFSDIPADSLQKWEALGYSILQVQHSIYQRVPDFVSKQKGQLSALSRNVIKEQRFHNDAVLSKSDVMNDSEFIRELKSKTMMIKTAVITVDRTLKIVLVKPVAETLEHTATFLSRLADSHGVALNSLKLYGQDGMIVVCDIQGTELFYKPI